MSQDTGLEETARDGGLWEASADPDGATRIDLTQSHKYGAPADCDGLKHGESETRIRYKTSTVAFGATCEKETQSRTCQNGELSDWSGNYTATACKVAPWELLLAQRVGFGRTAEGGSGGALCDVTTLKDAGPGSLRACAEASGPRWIRFKVSGKLPLGSPIKVKSHKTIDGRGSSVTITKHGLRIDGVEHVIVHNLRFDEGGSSDAITIKNKARHIWIDHVHLEEYGDGLIDITKASTDVTVSWCRFEDHDKVMLISASSSDTGDKVIRVTLHHNYFRRTTQRHPRLRFGKVHAFNNYLYEWKLYGMASCLEGQLLSERNIFEPGASKLGVLSTDCPSNEPAGYVQSRKDWELNGVSIDEKDTSKVFEAKSHYSYTAETADSALRAKIMKGAGRRSVGFPQ